MTSSSGLHMLRLQRRRTLSALLRAEQSTAVRRHRASLTFPGACAQELQREDQKRTSSIHGGLSTALQNAVDKFLMPYDTLGNSAAVRAEMVELSNYLDNMYSMLNIRVVLVGLEIWTTMNYINIDGSAGEVLGRFVQWRETQLLPRRRHDSAQLVLKKKFGGTAGMAFVGTVCSRSHAGGINVFSTQTLQSFSSIVAHELGHNLGMNHDNDRGCKCSTQYCIMNSGASDSKNFSSCSEDDFEKLILNKGGTCLLNVPRPDESYTAPFCGNRLVDPGEECDCGNEKECEKDPCCQPGKCKLRSGAECANGACCQNCRFSPGGTVCRAVTNECDLPEYCNGSSPFCQPDVFIQNGNPCQNTKAYCYNGVCQYYDAQCQRIFGPNAKSAAPICFQNVNSKGDRFGNCGYQGSAYKSCESRNAMCGKLQCENVNSMPIFGIAPSIIQTPVQDIICWGVDFQLGSDVPDPAMVNEGTKCAEGKVCKGFQCVDSAALGYDCDVQNKCAVCNSNKNCHCSDGWAYPNCKNKGYGGSVDSGPTYNDKDTSLRDGLLIFFLLVVPLLALGAFVFFRRNELKRKFCGRRRSHGYDSHGGLLETSGCHAKPSVTRDHVPRVTDGLDFSALPTIGHSPKTPLDHPKCSLANFRRARTCTGLSSGTRLALQDPESMLFVFTIVEFGVRLFERVVHRCLFILITSLNRAITTGNEWRKEETLKEEVTGL
ncbi:unnamed protein product [Ranitomeya imitator]|uniref:Disintegrin and metalloproteinase domain-containing protein 9 n=1 Tax=Ranitomeya imitator TaxID=111125 RepID=A0ABN9MDG2_9NEOB|nr:unnamed protein product [Ranitomeya imitator]